MVKKRPGACLSIPREPRWLGEGADARRAAPPVVVTTGKPCNAADAPLPANPSGPGRFPLMRRCRLLIGYLPNLVGSALPEGKSAAVAATRNTQTGSSLTRAQDRRLHPVRPLTCVRCAPFEIGGARYQPRKEFISLAVPTGMAEQYRTVARFDGEASAKSEGRGAAGPREARRVLRERILLGADLKMQSSIPAEQTDVRLHCADQRDAMHKRGRIVKGGPGTIHQVPLQHHALTAKIDDRYVGTGGRVHPRSLRYSRIISNRVRQNP